MLIWSLVLVLFVGFAAVGYFKGAIRMLIPLVGLAVGIWLALPLAPMVKPLIPKLGLENPIWSLLLPPVIVFFAINLLFVILGFFGHAKVNLFYKYQTDDVHRLNWQRLNQRLGLCVGFFAATVYSVLIGVVVYVLGYLTVQVSGGDNENAALRYLNTARAELRTTGLEQIAAVFDPAPDRFYEGADILGLLHHNPALHSRLAAYPPFIALAERQEFQDIANDAEYQNLLATQPSLGQVIEHPKTQTIVASGDILDQLNQIDLRDLREYLRTGVSEKYQETPILGRWEIDPYSTFLLEKKRRRNMTAADVKILRFEMEFVKGFKMFVAPDNSVRLKGPDISQLIGKLTEMSKAVAEGAKPRPQVQVIQTPAPAAVDPQVGAQNARLAERYGLNRGRGGPGGAPAQPQAAPMQQVVAAPVQPAVPANAAELASEIAQLPVVTLAQGTWKEEDGRFVFSFSGEKNIQQFVGTRRSSAVEASVRDDKLVLKENDQSMVLGRF